MQEGFEWSPLINIPKWFLGPSHICTLNMSFVECLRLLNQLAFAFIIWPQLWTIAHGGNWQGSISNLWNVHWGWGQRLMLDHYWKISDFCMMLELLNCALQGTVKILCNSYLLLGKKFHFHGSYLRGSFWLLQTCSFLGESYATIVVWKVWLEALWTCWPFCTSSSLMSLCNEVMCSISLSGFSCSMPPFLVQELG